jgi:hypothetical protein
MWKHVDSWARSARDLGVDISGPMRITIGKFELYPDMLILHFGAPNGTFVFEKWPGNSVLEELKANGYTCSSFLGPSENYHASRDDLIEVLSDWGWCGPEDGKPSWLLED